ncbi:MAG: SHOCT domain-containing protein [Gammaproteobacteria bacterium]|nr:SHOCT domain-containing protein [Gammaproteobacteria bacterium]
MNDGFLGFGPAHWGLGLVVWLLIIIAFVALYFAIRNKSRHEGGADRRQKSALEILQQRYDRGEIDADEFAEKKRHLES